MQVEESKNEVNMQHYCSDQGNLVCVEMGKFCHDEDATGFYTLGLGPCIAIIVVRNDDPIAMGHYSFDDDTTPENILDNIDYRIQPDRDEESNDFNYSLICIGGEANSVNAIDELNRLAAREDTPEIDTSHLGNTAHNHAIDVYTRCANRELREASGKIVWRAYLIPEAAQDNLSKPRPG